jgi:hypothetical protein
MPTTTYYLRDPKKGAKKGRGAQERPQGVPENVGEVTENPENAVMNEDGKAVIACVVVRGEDNGTD